jgi:bifunctional DNA-binding transcriptional regulator/antitoxin component of YhaV-PrlF toxin-antitoxin module
MLLPTTRTETSLRAAITTMGERGLLRVPAAVRDETGIDKGQELIVIAAGPGRIVLTTRSAIQDEVWAAAPGGAGTTSMRAERDADNAVVAAKRKRTRAQATARTDRESDRIGAALVTKFGV